MDPILLKFREKFYDEANGLLDRLEKDLLELEKNPEDKELIESAFRAMHTIKGVGGMYGYDFICEFTHSMESLYQNIRDKKMIFNKDISEITLQSIDHIRKLLNDEKMIVPENHKNHLALLANIEKLLGSSTIKINEQSVENKDEKEPITGNSTFHILLRTNESIYFRGISLINIFKELADYGFYQVSKLDYLSDAENDVWSVIFVSDAEEDDIRDIFLFIEDECVITKISDDNLFENEQKLLKEQMELAENDVSIIDYIEKGSKPSSASKVKKLIQEEALVKKVYINTEKQIVKRISVDSTKLDNLMYLVSELITVNSQLSLATHDAQFNVLKPYVEKVDALSKLFRNNALEIRLVPLSDTILRFQRLIRDLSKQLGKKIDLATHGIDTELDKNTIDQLNEPLMHIIRNCIDHGIELPEQRKSKGKDESGTIKISAFHSGNFIVIKIEDDGSGINCEKVRLKAIEKGLLKASDKPTRNDLFNMIFLPGFSTAQSLTDVSGRGVGMDVVRKRIIDLRGDIHLDSIEGKGTSFTLKLQQSVAIIDTLLFTVEESYFIVPVADIIICSQFTDEEINARRHTATLPFNNSLVPFIDLREKLNIKGCYNKKIKVVIIRNNEHQLALLTDKIVGEHQAVLKPLGKLFRNQDYITSASQLGDGNLALMIDSGELFKQTYLQLS